MCWKAFYRFYDMAPLCATKSWMVREDPILHFHYYPYIYIYRNFTLNSTRTSSKVGLHTIQNVKIHFIYSSRRHASLFISTFFSSSSFFFFMPLNNTIHLDINRWVFFQMRRFTFLFLILSIFVFWEAIYFHCTRFFEIFIVGFFVYSKKWRIFLLVPLV